jgi:hypothetical protein
MNVRKHGRTLILRLASRPTKKHARHRPGITMRRASRVLAIKDDLRQLTLTVKSHHGSRFAFCMASTAWMSAAWVRVCG